MIIVYTSKPHLARILAPFLATIFSNKKIVFIHSMYFTNVTMNYHKNIHWKQFPYIQNPEFKINTVDKWRANTLIDTTLSQIEITMDDISNCEKIIYMGEPSYHDVYSFSIFFEHIFKISVENKNIDAIALYSLAPSDVQKAWNDKANFYDMFKEHINYGKVVRYFDYNFNFNSFALFGKTYSYIDKILPTNDFGNIFFSKYMIQLLYFVKNKESNCIHYKEGYLIKEMSRWKGTGKYNDRVKLGGKASFCSIIKNLIDLKLLEIRNIEGTNYIYITDKGTQFLTYLPKDCMDFDLPFRIKFWAEESFEISKIKMDIYLHNYYKKVKNKLTALDN